MIAVKTTHLSLTTTMMIMMLTVTMVMMMITAREHTDLTTVRDNISDSSFDAEETSRTRHLPGPRVVSQNSFTGGHAPKDRRSRMSGLQQDPGYSRMESMTRSK